MVGQWREQTGNANGCARRAPAALLSPYVSELWCVERASPRPFDREATLPSGAAHVVFRLGAVPVRLFATSDDAQGESLGQAVVCGLRSRTYLRDVTWPTISVGASLCAGAAGPLFGVTGAELAERHVALEDLWGADAASALGRLAEATTASARLDVLERALLSRLSPVRAMNPAIAQALEALRGTPRIAELVAHSGYSHRRFVSLFRDAVGLPPKPYARLLRFRRALALVQADLPLAQIACAVGYADQAHFTREFHEHAGLAPSVYRAEAGSSPHHVPVLGSISFKTGRPVRGTV